MKKILALLLSLLVTPALAQTAPTPDPVSIYMASVPLAVTTSSARVQLPSASVSAAALTISNDGTNDVCIAKGTVTVVATNACLSGASTSASFLIPAGRTITIFKNSTETYLAAIGAGNSTLHVYQSNGPVWIQGTAAGTGGGAVTQGTSPWVTSDSTAQGNIGATNSAAAANPSATAGLNGVLKGFWTSLSSFLAGPTASVPSVVGFVELVDKNGNAIDFTSASPVIPTSQYPSGATPITGNSTGTTGAVVGTLAGTSGKTTYLCGWDASAVGGTAAVGPITVAGTKTSSMVYQLNSAAAPVQTQHNYFPCVPASATNTAITITTTADGTATAVDVNSWGYQL